MDNQPNQPQKGGNKAQWIVLLIVILAVVGYGIYAYVSSNADNTNSANTNGNSNQAANINASVNANSTANQNSNIIANSSKITGKDSKYIFNNTSSNVAFEFPSEWSVKKDLIATTGHNIELVRGSEQTQNPTPYNNNAIIKIEVLKKAQVSGYDWPEGVGGLIRESKIKVNGIQADERISESTNQLAFPDNTIPQLSSAILLVGNENIMISSLYTGGDQRNQILQEFENIISSLTY